MVDASMVQDFFWQVFQIPPDQMWGAIASAILASALIFFIMEIVLRKITGEETNKNGLVTGVSLVFAVGTMIYVWAAGVWELLIGLYSILILAGFALLFLVFMIVWRTHKTKYYETSGTMYGKKKEAYNAKQAWKKAKKSRRWFRKAKHDKGVEELFDELMLLRMMNGEIVNIINALNDILPKLKNRELFSNKDSIDELIKAIDAIIKDINGLIHIYNKSRHLMKKENRHRYLDGLKKLSEVRSLLKKIKGKLESGKKDPSKINIDEEISALYAAIEELKKVFNDIANLEKPILSSLNSVSDWLGWLNKVLPPFKEHINEIYVGLKESPKSAVALTRESAEYLSLKSSLEEIKADLNKFIKGYNSMLVALGIDEKRDAIIIKTKDLLDDIEPLLGYLYSYKNYQPKTVAKNLKPVKKALEKYVELIQDTAENAKKLTKEE